MLEELLLAVTASLIFSCIVWFGVRLQGQWVLFWLVYLVTLSTGIGVLPTTRSHVSLHTKFLARSNFPQRIFCAPPFGAAFGSLLYEVGLCAAVLAYTVAACAPNMDVANAVSAACQGWLTCS
jgi:amino acid permease